MPKLTEKQKRFIDFYIELGNASEAARQAGYRGKNLNRIGAENLSKLDIAIRERLAAKEDARIAKQDEVLRYLTEVMRSGYDETKDRIKAAELLGRRYALFTDKLDINTPITVVIQDDYGD